MSEPGNLMPFGDVSKAATVLMEKIADSVTGFCLPWQIKRVANAEAEAKIIAKRADIEVLELEERALQRFVAEETAKQSNMETIASKAIPHLNVDADPSKMEKDWITNFMDRCRLISDDEMQGMWSKILAGEANSPGSISKQSVNIMSQMDKNDALMFQKFASFVLSGETSALSKETRSFPFIIPSIFNGKHWKDFEFDVMTKWDLQNLGLVDVCQGAGEFTLSNLEVGDKLTYFDETIRIISVDLNIKEAFPFGLVDFTRPGIQLFKLCSPLKLDGFCEEVIKFWDEKGIKCLLDPVPTAASSPESSS